MNAILPAHRALPLHQQPGAPDASAVYERLGVIVRELHDTLRELGADGVLADAASQFPCARGRLLHIADLTENAANVVLSKVEEHGPAQEQLAREAQSLLQELDTGAVPADRITAFLANVASGCGSTRAALSDIMMAQDFQDLTGQLIKKVVVLMESTEENLLKLLIDAAPPGAIVAQAREELTAGPGAHGSVALDQTSVDDLLGELGF
ncbi:protein phosphatase CheZ [Duganella sp. FT3S]|uniref:Protein phosphatase CheZ n=1 Tax=Rugamonas fusca TaxID=2758568 RepID=A0A7W2I8S7_9BURK|nr:protein phosphatase CheZ [Rugamonas fusca]MBA5607790.1 protein phosphatase CheZ [Rugamonas fusca]